MQMSEYGLGKLKQWEGFRDRAYQDAAGVWTIGYGHTLGVQEGDVCTKAQAERWLRADVAEAENCVNKSVQVPLSVHQFDALVSFVFNVGIRAFRSSTLLRRLNAGRYEEVPSEWVRWSKITDPKTKQKRVSKGLSNRRAAELGLWAKESKVASAAKVAEPQGSDVKGALATGTVTGAASVAATVTASGAILQAAAPHLETLEGLVHKAPIVLAVVAILAVVGVVIWRIKRK